jgi:predicted ABC-type ATPase
MPTIYVIAGPNGIGKTTSSYDLVPANTPIINSDEIAKEVRSAGIISVNTQEYSNQEAVRLLEEQRKLHNSFAIETNLSDLDTWKFLLEVRKTGYQLHVLYMSTNDLEMLNKRIAGRTLLGEHFVKPDIVEERYVTSLKLLDHFFNKADKLQLYDNSEKVQLIAEISQGQLLHHIDPLPNWITKYLGKHFQQDFKKENRIKDMTIDEVPKIYQLDRERAIEVQKKLNQSKDQPHEESRDQKIKQGRRPRL